MNLVDILSKILIGMSYVTVFLFFAWIIKLLIKAII